MYCRAVRENEDSHANADQSETEYVFDLVTDFDPNASQLPAWVRHQLGEWVVNYLMVAEDGVPAIRSLVIQPGDIDDPDLPLSLAPGGISARLLRRLRPAEAQRFARSELAERARPEDPLADAVALHGYGELALQADRRPGRRGRPDRFYAEIAAEYAKALDARSPHPVKDVAERMNYSRARIRDLLVEARRRGLLTETERGRAAGQLTDKGREALQARTTPHDSRQREKTPQRTSAPPKVNASELASTDEENARRNRRELAQQVDQELDID